MNERMSEPLFLKEIIEEYPTEDNYSEAKDSVTGKIRPVFSRVYRNAEGKIVYVEPQSIRWNNQAPPNS